MGREEEELINLSLCILNACTYVHMHSWCLCRPEEGVEFSGTGVMDVLKLPSGRWELN